VPDVQIDDEGALRARLAASVTELRSVMNRIPVPLDPAGEAPEVIEEALALLVTAECASSELAAIEGATEQAAMLAASASMSLQMIRHSLALLCAELDSRSVA